MIRVFLFVALLAVPWPGLAQAQAQTSPMPQSGPAEWEERWYNPKPAADDFLLPLPCGGKLVFRPVDVPASADPLADRAMMLGDPEVDPFGYIEYVRSAFLAAPFPAPDGGRRYFIGKYTVTRDQYAAMTGKPCQPPAAPGRVAMNNVSHPDAMAAATAWSSWLLANARDALPQRRNTPDSARGFVRLPTEEEWEFAARGGTKVSEQEFLGRTWPIPEGIERYAMAGSRQAGGRAQQVGQLLPNPLGLHDMLGNVAQMTLEPFRLNRVGRSHGQAGGVVARGGNYTSPPASLHTAMRVEIPPYNRETSAPSALATVGFRLVIAAVTVDGLAETEAIRRAFVAASAQGQAEADATDPRRLIARLKEVTADGALRQGLDRLEARLAQDNRGRGDEASATVGAQLEAAAGLATAVWTLENSALLTIEIAEAFYKNIPAVKQELLASAADLRAQQIPGVQGYMRQLRMMATGSARRTIPDQLDVLRREFEGRGERRLSGFLPMIARHAALLQNSQLGQWNAERVCSDILSDAPTQPPPGCRR